MNLILKEFLKENNNKQKKIKKMSQWSKFYPTNFAGKSLSLGQTRFQNQIKNFKWMIKKKIHEKRRKKGEKEKNNELKSKLNIPSSFPPSPPLPSIH